MSVLKPWAPPVCSSDWSSLDSVVRLSLPAFAALLAFPDELLRLFGGAFVAGAAVTVILACGQLVNAATGPCDCDRNLYNCRDFDTQAEAQTCFQYCLDTQNRDVHNLDGGGDGFVCESLP